MANGTGTGGDQGGTTGTGGDQGGKPQALTPGAGTATGGQSAPEVQGAAVVQEPKKVDKVDSVDGVDAGAAAEEEFVLPTGYPRITNIYPRAGNTGTRVTITGRNFGNRQNKGVAAFNSVPCVVQAWADKEIVVECPALLPGPVGSHNLTIKDVGVTVDQNWSDNGKTVRGMTRAEDRFTYN